MARPIGSIWPWRFAEAGFWNCLKPAKNLNSQLFALNKTRNYEGGLHT